MGRPTKYHKKFCEQLVDHMKKGLSFESFAADCECHKETLYEWVNQHPEFSEAKKRGTAFSSKRWEEIGMAGMAGKIKGFNAAVWIFNMKNRFHWRDKRELDITPQEPPQKLQALWDEVTLLLKDVSPK